MKSRVPVRKLRASVGTVGLLIVAGLLTGAGAAHLFSGGEVALPVAVAGVFAGAGWYRANVHEPTDADRALVHYVVTLVALAAAQSSGWWFHGPVALAQRVFQAISDAIAGAVAAVMSGAVSDVIAGAVSDLTSGVVSDAIAGTIAGAVSAALSVVVSVAHWLEGFCCGLSPGAVFDHGAVGPLLFGGMTLSLAWLWLALRDHSLGRSIGWLVLLSASLGGAALLGLPM